MAEFAGKRFESPDEVREFADDKGRVELVDLNGHAVGRGTFEPGWRWSEHLRRASRGRLMDFSALSWRYPTKKLSRNWVGAGQAVQSAVPQQGAGELREALVVLGLLVVADQDRAALLQPG